MSKEVNKTQVRPSRVSQPIAGKKPVKRGIRPQDMALVGLGLLGTLVIVALLFSSSLSGNGAAAAGNPTPVPAGPVPAVGAAAPDFSLPGNDGNTYSLSQFKGKTVLLEFMAPWCPHCQADSPTFAKIATDYKDKGVQLLGVSATPFGKDLEAESQAGAAKFTLITMADLTWFRDQFSVNYPLLLDKDTRVGPALYGVQSYPTVFIIDSQGKVAANPDQAGEDAVLRAALDKVVGK
jgi:peroxiredoxin